MSDYHKNFSEDEIAWQNRRAEERGGFVIINPGEKVVINGK